MKIPRSDYEDIFELVRNGTTYKAIADRYGATPERIRQLCKNAGLSSGIDERRKRKLRSLLSELPVESYELFFHSEYNCYDLIEECKLIYKWKKWYCDKKHIPFYVELTSIIWNRICPISGTVIDYYAPSRTDCAPEITLINPHGGYVDGNVQTVARSR